MTPQDARSIAIAISLTLCLGAAEPLYAASNEPLSRPWSFVQRLANNIGDAVSEVLTETALMFSPCADTQPAADQASGDGGQDDGGEIGGDIEPNG